MTRNTLWLLPVLWLISAVQAEGEVPECVNVPQEKMARLKDLVVKEDVHDKLVGEFTELWVTKAYLEERDNRCTRYHRTRVDDKVLFQTIELTGERSPLSNSTLEKVENGIYLVKRTGVEEDAVAKLHVLYADNKAVAYFVCGLSPTSPGDSSLARLSLLTQVDDRTTDLRTLPQPDTMTSVNQSISRVKDHQDLLGEIVLSCLLIQPESCLQCD